MTDQQTRRRWVRDEILLALSFYKTNHSDIRLQPSLIALSKSVGHSTGSVKALLENFKGFDPEYTKDGRKGLEHGSRLVGEVFAEFINEPYMLAKEIERIRKERSISVFDKS